MLRRISTHAIDQYMGRVDKRISRYKVRVALFHIYRIGHDATCYEAKSIRHEDVDGETTLRIAETCFGLIVMPIKRGVMTTCWALEVWRRSEMQ